MEKIMTQDMARTGLFTVDEVAAILRISRSQVYVLMNDGLLESVHLRKSRRISQGQLTRFIQSLEA